MKARRDPRRRQAGAFLLVAAAALAAYLPSFSVPFQFDDYARIFDNDPLREGRYLEAIGWLGGSRLLPSTTLVLNYWVGGESVFGYHAFNFAVHLLATLAVFLLALALCRTPRLHDAWSGDRALALATVAAFLFACHPLQTQAVSYIIQRSATMATAFYTWSVLLYVWARNRPAGRARTVRFAAAAALAIAAVFSKENAVTLPGAFLLTELVFYGSSWRKVRRALPFAAAATVMIAIPIAWRLAIWQPRAAAELSLGERVARTLLYQGDTGRLSVDPLDYFFTQCVVLPRYLGLLVVPLGLNVDHDVAVRDRLSGDALAGLLLLAALAAVGLWLVKRRPLVGFGILWFFLAMSVESSFIPILDTMMEHRVYLAMPGLALGLGSLLVWLGFTQRRLAVAGGLLLLAVLPALTFARNRVWQSPLDLWSDAARKSPDKARVHVNLGVAYHGLDRLDEAIHHYCRALELDPKIAVAGDNLEIALESRGDLDAAMAEIMKNAKPIRRRDGSLLLEYDLARVVCPEQAER